jgi:hypothetical protein
MIFFRKKTERLSALGSGDETALKTDAGMAREHVAENHLV